MLKCFFYVYDGNFKCILFCEQYSFHQAFQSLKALLQTFSGIFSRLDGRLETCFCKHFCSLFSYCACFLSSLLYSLFCISQCSSVLTKLSENALVVIAASEIGTDSSSPKTNTSPARLLFFTLSAFSESETNVIQQVIYQLKMMMMIIIIIKIILTMLKSELLIWNMQQFMPECVLAQLSAT